MRRLCVVLWLYMQATAIFVNAESYDDEKPDHAENRVNAEPRGESKPELAEKSLGEGEALPNDEGGKIDREPTAVVNSVNVISGSYNISDMDFVMAGAEPFALQRSYGSADVAETGEVKLKFDNSKPLGVGWGRNYFSRLNRDYNKKKRKTESVEIIDEYGATYDFEGSSRYTFDLPHDVYEKGHTNCAGGTISASTDISNTKLFREIKSNPYMFIKPSGAKTIFTKKNKNAHWLFTNEKLTNGNERVYSYDKKDRNQQISALDREGNHLSSLNFVYANHPDGTKVLSLESESGNLVRYRFDNFKGKRHHRGFYLIEVIRTHAPMVTYDYEDHNDGARTVKIRRKNLPNNRFEEVEYYRKGHNSVGSTEIRIKGKEDPRIDRVKLQKAPVGHDATPIITNRYLYKFKAKGSELCQTHMYNALDHLTTYEWNNQYRLEGVCKYLGQSEHSLYSKEKLYFGDPKTDQCTYLKARTLEDRDGNIKFIRSFDYNEHGNVLEDKLWGDLTGTRPEPCVAPKDGAVNNDCAECYVDSYTYSEDSLHLMQSHTRGHNKDLFFYLPGTDLLVKKLYTYMGAIYKREYYEYAACGVVTKEIEDDGTSDDMGNYEGVTERRIKYIKLREQYPFGLPEIIDEAYLAPEKDHDILFKKTVYRYTAEGWVSKKDIYDCNNVYVCSFKWEYDRFGNPIKEVDPSGHATTRKFDENSNKIFEQGPNLQFHTEYTYDFSNRLINVKEVHSDGINLELSFRYDYLGRKIGSTDSYGNEMRYVYDELSRLVEVISPAVPDAEGRMTQISEKKEYDLLGNSKGLIDGRGFATLQENTIRGKPYSISYPDGTQETNTYNLDGTLDRHTDRCGNYTIYSYDEQQRAISERLYSKTGEMLSAKSCTHNAFQLVSETDIMGRQKRYKYDAGGRLIETTTGDNRTTYEYDSLGRESKIIEWCGVDESGCDGGIAHKKLYNCMDRVIEESTEDLKGNCLSRVKYRYDCEGQKICTVKHIDGLRVVERTYYDSRHKPYKFVDGAGNMTYVLHRYDYRNSMGQIVPYSEATSPDGSITISIHDALDRVQVIEKKSHMGTLIQKQEMFYDACNNKIRHVEHSIKEGDVEGKTIYEWNYDSQNRLIATQESANRKAKRWTHISYDRMGRKKSITKPNGVKLSHSYDDYGRLSTFKSSDGTVSYSYGYDKAGNLLLVEDLVEGTKTTMEYDGNDRLVAETLGNGLRLEHRYDEDNKPIEMMLPDGSGLGFAYDGSRLRQIRRLSVKGDPLYTHSYDRFDSSGNLLEMTLIGNCGKAMYAYDGAGRQTRLSHVEREEDVYYSLSGNVLSKKIKYRNGIDQDEDEVKADVSSYEYDALSQLINEKSLSFAHEYAYDSMHNRTSKDGNRYHLNALNELTTDKSKRYAYDANGNTTEIRQGDDVIKLGYDALDRLRTLECNGVITTYAYDYLHRRLTRERGIQNAEKVTEREKGSQEGTCERFLWVGQEEIGCYNAEGSCLELRVLGHGKGAEIGAAVAIEIGGEVYAPLHDPVGNVVALLDPKSGKTVEKYSYSAFGEHILMDSEGKSLEKALSPWLFSSKRFDYESGFIYFGRRFYNPETGRWLTTDPISTAGGMNLYAFVLNNPLNKIDLHGLCPTMADVGGYIMSGLSYAGQALTLPGRIVEQIGYHLVPLPFVRDVIQVVGRVLSFQSFKDYKWSPENQSGMYHLGRFEVPGHRMHIVNGIFTSKEEMDERALALSDKHGGINVHYYHNSSWGIISDIATSAIQLMGFQTPSGNLYASCMRRLTNEALYEAPGGGVTIEAHSQGSILVRNLQYYPETAGLTQHMDVTTCASPTFYGKNSFNRAINLVSNRDIVPALDPMGYVSAWFWPSPSVKFLPSRCFPFIDHCYDNKSYSKEREDIYKNVRRKLGI